MRLRTGAAMVLPAALLLVLPVGAGPVLAAGPGTPWTWGGNGFGELGDGTTASHLTAGARGRLRRRRRRGARRRPRAGGRPARRRHGVDLGLQPVRPARQRRHRQPADARQVAGLAGVAQITAGHYHSMALLGDGTVRTWGMNAQGQLGEAAGPGGCARCRSATSPG